MKTSGRFPTRKRWLPKYAEESGGELGISSENLRTDKASAILEPAEREETGPPQTDLILLRGNDQWAKN